MTWFSISATPTQYMDANGDPYSGAVLKFYQNGTSTPISLATDNTGGTTATSVALNASGYPEVSGSVIIPHVEEEYKISLYATQTAADANTGALWSIDNITPAIIAGTNTDINVKVSSNDTTTGYLNGKLVAGTNVTLTEGSDGGNETLTISSADTKGSDVASAAALTVGAGNYFDITGTTAITSITTIGIGTVIKLHFDGILTLTHHATDLILPGGANIITAVGDEAEFIEYDAGDWRLLGYIGSRNHQRDALSFTPALIDNSGSEGEGQTYSTQLGWVNRIGGLLFVDIDIQVSSIGTLATGEPARILMADLGGGVANLPPHQANGVASSFVCGEGTNMSIAAGQVISGKLRPGQNAIQLYTWDTTNGATDLTIGEFSATGRVLLSGFYPAA